MAYSAHKVLRIFERVVFENTEDDLGLEVRGEIEVACESRD